MVDYIKSKSIKEYLKQEGVELTDLQKTVLILRTGYPMETIHASLGEIAESTSDEQLKGAILEKIQRQYQEVVSVKEKQCHVVYTLEIYEPDEEKYINEGYYNSYEAAEKHARYFSVEYIIRKYRLFGEEGIENHFHSVYGYLQADLGALLFNVDGKVIKYFPSVCIPEEGKQGGILDSYCMAFRHPFRKGDIVKNLLTGDTGVVNDCECTLDKWIEQKESLVRCGNYKDAGILVEYADPVGNFFQLHTFPYDLEYAQAPETGWERNRFEVLKEAQCLLIGEGSLDRFTGCKIKLEAKKRYW